MASKAKSLYRCSECGHGHPKWVGRCESCGVWNSVVEEPAVSARTFGGMDVNPRVPIRLDAVGGTRVDRWSTGLAELDHVLGGGLVAGSMTLIGGEPGIGKSTLLLQMAAQMAGGGRTVLYASGEESVEQLRVRADRLSDTAGDVLVLGETRLEGVIAAAVRTEAALLIVDSVQTAFLDVLESAPGSVAQVRECAARLMRFAKETGTAVMVVGHVTKGGGIAGPKTLEHIVDTVLYFEGERTQDFRLLRVTKHRFGSVDELGVFAMTARGLEPVPNPSALFLADRSVNASGSAVTALLEGTRAILVEIQTLTTPAGYGTPQRVAAGLDPKRLAVLLAVLERRAGFDFSAQDVFVQVSAGLRLADPAGDLAIAAALVSSVRNRPVRSETLFLGEVGLGGEVRRVAGVERRMAEAARLGFSQVCSGPMVGEKHPEMGHLLLGHVDQLGTALAA